MWKNNEIIQVGFQFTLPCGERLFYGSIMLTMLEFQFTLPCGERLKEIFMISVSKTISIHAPVWGATSAPFIAGFTPTDFNSRSRVGSDITIL